MMYAETAVPAGAFHVSVTELPLELTTRPLGAATSAPPVAVAARTLADRKHPASPDPCRHRAKSPLATELMVDSIRPRVEAAIARLQPRVERVAPNPALAGLYAEWLEGYRRASRVMRKAQVIA